METRELFDLLEKLYKTSVLGLSRLARALNISYNKLYVFINSLRRLGFEIVPCINLRFVKLGVMIVLSDKPIIDDCKPLFPKGHFVLLMVPLDIGYKDLRSIIGPSVSSLKVYFIEEAQLPKPMLAKYNVDSSFEILKKERVWRLLLETIERIDRMQIEHATYSNIVYSERYKVSKIDLKIMNELVKDPFISSKKLAEKLGISVGKLRRRMVIRIEPLMKGYRVLWAPYYRLFNAILFNVFRVKSISSRILYEILSEFPLSVLTAYNSNENIIVNALLVDSLTYDYTRKYLRIAEREYGVEIIDSWGYLYSGLEKQVIPCRALVEYDKRSKRFRLKMPPTRTTGTEL